MRAIKITKTGGLGRRRFLTTVGAGGVTAAVAVFAASKAEAASCGCCGLVYCPPTTSLSHCDSVSHYQWECTETNGGLYCNCCEVKNSQGLYTASAYQCQY